MCYSTESILLESGTAPAIQYKPFVEGHDAVGPTMHTSPQGVSSTTPALVMC